MSDNQLTLLLDKVKKTNPEGYIRLGEILRTAQPGFLSSPRAEAALRELISVTEGEAAELLNMHLNRPIILPTPVICIKH